MVHAHSHAATSAAVTTIISSSVHGKNTNEIGTVVQNRNDTMFTQHPAVVLSLIVVLFLAIVWLLYTSMPKE